MQAFIQHNVDADYYRARAVRYAEYLAKVRVNSMTDGSHSGESGGYLCRTRVCMYVYIYIYVYIYVILHIALYVVVAHHFYYCYYYMYLCRLRGADGHRARPDGRRGASSGRPNK